MSFLALRRSFPLIPEVNSDLIAQFFEDVLRLEIRDELGSHMLQGGICSDDRSDGQEEGGDVFSTALSPPPQSRGGGEAGPVPPVPVQHLGGRG